MKHAVLAAAVLLSACMTVSAPDGFARVTPSQLAADPTAWDGRQVQVTGLMTWEFENLGLYESRDAYCEGAAAAAIYVEWEDWPGVTRADNRRTVTVRGTFRNEVGVKHPDGTIVISTGAPGPGPLEPGAVVRWGSPPLSPCG